MTNPFQAAYDQGWADALRYIADKLRANPPLPEFADALERIANHPPKDTP
jgi:hypothetical protein